MTQFAVIALALNLFLSVGHADSSLCVNEAAAAAKSVVGQDPDVLYAETEVKDYNLPEGELLYSVTITDESNTIYSYLVYLKTDSCEILGINGASMRFNR